MIITNYTKKWKWGNKMKNPIVTIEMENGDIMKAELYQK